MSEPKPRRIKDVDPADPDVPKPEEVGRDPNASGRLDEDEQREAARKERRRLAGLADAPPTKVD